jgi:hypothetical protein
LGLRARYLVGCAAVIGWSLAIVMPVFGPVPMLWYYPLEHTFDLSARAHGFATSWYGRSTLALLGGVTGFVLGAIIVRVTRARSQRAVTLGTLWAVVAVVLALSVYAYQLAHRVPVPEPLPTAFKHAATPARSLRRTDHDPGAQVAHEIRRERHDQAATPRCRDSRPTRETVQRVAELMDDAGLLEA